jgi:PPOX class probable F420-dependent enzyme
MIQALDPDLSEVLDGAPIAHVATVLPDGAPHSVPVWIGTHEHHVVIMTGPGSQKARNLRKDPRIAISLTPPDNPFRPIILRGRVVEWLDGERGWAVIDQLAQKYLGTPYGRERQRVVALIEVEHRQIGMREDMHHDVTDDQVQALASTARPFSFAQLRWGPDRHQDGADAIEREHQRRMVSLRANGVIAVLCPVVSDTVAGVAIMTEPPERARETMAADPCVQAGMMTCEVLPCLGFPGDELPA